MFTHQMLLLATFSSDTPHPIRQQPHHPLAFPPHEQVSLPALWPPPPQQHPPSNPGSLPPLCNGSPSCCHPQSPLAACPPHSSQTSFSREDLMSVTTSSLTGLLLTLWMKSIFLPASFFSGWPAYLPLPGHQAPQGVQVSVLKLAHPGTPV